MGFLGRLGPRVKQMRLLEPLICLLLMSTTVIPTESNLQGSRCAYLPHLVLCASRVFENSSTEPVHVCNRLRRTIRLTGNVRELIYKPENEAGFNGSYGSEKCRLCDIRPYSGSLAKKNATS